MMRSAKLVTLCALLICSTLLSGCWSSVEIDDLAFVMGIAVDLDEANGKYQITTQVGKPAAFKSFVDSGSGSGDSKAYVNYSRSGTGMEIALDELSRQVDRKLYTGHNQVVIISEEFAMGDIAPVMDYFVRDSDGRYTLEVFIAEGSAAEVLDISGSLENMPALYLMKLLDAQSGFGSSSKTMMIDVLTAMLSATSTPTIPIVKIVGEGDSKRLELDGMAVLKGGRMIAKLSQEQTKAMLIVKDEAKGGVFQISALGGNVALKIMSSAVDIAPVFAGDALEKITVTVGMACSVADISVDADLLREAVRDEIAKAFAREVSQMLQGTLEFSQQHSADIFGFGEKLHRYHPRKAKAAIENWEREYPDLAVEFEVNIEVVSTGAIIDPLTERSGSSGQ